MYVRGIRDPPAGLIGSHSIMVQRPDVGIVSGADCVKEVLELRLIHVMVQIQLSLQADRLIIV